MEEYHILSLVSNPESVSIPCPYICLKDTEETLSGIATHLNNKSVSHPLEDHIDPVPDEWDAQSVRDAIPLPFMASSMPILCQINLTDLRTNPPNTVSEQYESLVCKAIAHETLHIVLTHIEGQDTSTQLDEIEVSLSA